MSKTEEQLRAEARILAEEAEKVKEEKEKQDSHNTGMGCLTIIIVVFVAKWLWGLLN